MGIWGRWTMAVALAIAIGGATVPAPAAPAPDTMARAVAPPAGAEPDSAARRISLEEAITLAEHNALAVIEAVGQERNGGAQVRSAYGAFLPSVSVSLDANRQLPARSGQTRIVNGQVTTLASQPWSFGEGLSTNLQLFAGGQRLFELSRAKSQAKLASTNLDDQRLLARVAAEQQYFNVLASRESEAAAAAQLEEAERQLMTSKLQLRARAVTRSDSLRSEIQVHNARLSVTQARTALAQAAASLSRVVGSEQPVTAADDAGGATSELAVDDAALRGLVLAGPAVRQAQATLDAARQTLRIAWTNYLPSVNAGYSRSGNAAGDAFTVSPDGMSYSGALRLSLSMPLFTQFQNEAQVTQAKVARDDAEAALRDARLAALESLTQTLGTYRAAGEQVDMQRATIEAATEDLREQQEKYTLGTATILDVLTSQTTLDQARHDLIQARYAERVARAQLEALAGRSL